MISPGWWHRLFTRRVTNNYSITTHQRENSRTLVWVEALFCTTESKTDYEYSWRIREMATCWLHICSPTEVSIAWRALPWASRSFSEKKKFPEMGNQPPQYCGLLCRSSYCSCTTGIMRAYVGLNHWGVERDRDRKRALQQPVHRSWQTEFLLAGPN